MIHTKWNLFWTRALNLSYFDYEIFHCAATNHIFYLSVRNKIELIKENGCVHRPVPKVFSQTKPPHVTVFVFSCVANKRDALLGFPISVRSQSQTLAVNFRCANKIRTCSISSLWLNPIFNFFALRTTMYQWRTKQMKQVNAFRWPTDLFCTLLPKIIIASFKFFEPNSIFNARKTSSCLEFPSSRCSAQLTEVDLDDRWAVICYMPRAKRADNVLWENGRKVVLRESFFFRLYSSFRWIFICITLSFRLPPHLVRHTPTVTSKFFNTKFWITW